MTPGQTRVLVLLGVLLALQALINPSVRSVLTGHLTSQQQSGGAVGIPGIYIAGFIGVGASAIALVALASPAPKLATWIVVIFIGLALIEHPQQWTAALSSATQGIVALTGGNLGGTQK